MSILPLNKELARNKLEVTVTDESGMHTFCPLDSSEIFESRADTIGYGAF